MTKRVAPVAINALKEALTAAYWYKSDLRSFLTHSLSDPAIVSGLDWNDNKRNIVGTLVEHLAKNEDRHHDPLSLHPDRRFGPCIYSRTEAR